MRLGEWDLGSVGTRWEAAVGGSCKMTLCMGGTTGVGGWVVGVEVLGEGGVMSGWQYDGWVSAGWQYDGFGCLLGGSMTGVGGCLLGGNTRDGWQQQSPGWRRVGGGRPVWRVIPYILETTVRIRCWTLRPTLHETDAHITRDMI